MDHTHYDRIIDQLEMGLVESFNFALRRLVSDAAQKLTDGMECSSRCILAPGLILPDAVVEQELPTLFLGYGSTVENPEAETPGVNYSGEIFTVSLYLVLGESPQLLDDDNLSEVYRNALAETDVDQRNTEIESAIDGFAQPDLLGDLELGRNELMRRMSLLRQAALFQHTIKNFIRAHQSLGNPKEQTDTGGTIIDPSVQDGYGTSGVRLASVQKYEERISSREFLQFDIAVDVYFPTGYNPYAPIVDC